MSNKNEEINDKEINEEINDKEINNEEIIDDSLDIESIEEEISEMEIEDSVEEDDSMDNNENVDFDVLFKNNANKHKLEGTHALKRDTIFMGKLDETTAETDCYYTEMDNNNYELERGTAYESESRNYEDYYYQKCLSKEIYDILSSNTNLDFVTNRRKPNRQTFNNYYKLCVEELSKNYTKSEIFVELSYYFTDNIFNMFKLLDKKHATGIILELKDKGYLNNIGNIKFI